MTTSFLPEPDRRSEERSMTVPILVAILILAAAGAGAFFLFPKNFIHLEHISTKLLPTHTVFKSESIVVGPPTSVDALYVATTIRVENRSHIPITIDTLHCTLTDKDGGVLTVSAVQKDDLALIEQSFPDVKPFVPSLLLRDTTIAPGQSAEGTLLFSFSLPQQIWDTRQSAVIGLTLYHQPDLTLTIPK